MPPKKRGGGVPTFYSKPRSATQTLKPDPSAPALPPLQSSSDGPSPASRFTTQSPSCGPSGNKAIASPTAGQTVATREKTVVPAGLTALSQNQSVGPLSESGGGGSESTGSKSNLKKKVVKKVVRKVKKPSLTNVTQPELVDANSNMKLDLEKSNPIVDSIKVVDSEPSLSTSPVVLTEVMATTSEPLTSRPELNSEKSNEDTESTVPKGKVKKVIRKVIKKKIVKKMVPKGTLAAKKAAEEGLLSAQEHAKLGDVETNKAGQQMEGSIVHDVNPGRNPQSTKEESSPSVGEDNKHTDEKSTEREVDSRGTPSTEPENKKDCEEGKEAVIKVEEDEGNANKSNTDSVNRKEIKEEMKVGDDIKKEKPDCSNSSNERKVRKVIKKRIIKKLVPKGTLLTKRSSQESVKVPNSETKNHNPKREEALGEKPEAENPCPKKEEEKPRQGSVTTTADKISQNPNSGSNADAEETDGLTERQRRRKTEIFIGGLDKEVEEMDIRTVFGKAGEIVEVRMFVENNTGKNKGYCFLRYKEPAQAKKAISMFSKVEIRGKRCGAAPVEDHDSIFLGNINKRWKKDDIIRMLKDFGIEKIDCVTVMQDPQSPELNRGFAFLDLETNRDAQIAFKKLRAGDFSKGGHVRIDWAEPWHEPDEEEMLKVKSVFVECIPSSWDKVKMSEIFEKFGKIERVVLSRDIPSSKRKDYAFVNYTTREAAVSCVELIEKEELVENGSKVNIKVSLAKPVSKGKMTKGGGRPSASEKEKHKILQSNKSSTPNHLRVLRDPVPRQEIGNPKGKALETYRHGLHGEKRGISALSDGPEYSDVRGLPHPRYDNSYHGFYGSSTSSYGGTQPYGTREPSLFYQNPNLGYASGSFDGKQSYHPDASETRERAVLPHGHRSWPYPRCKSRYDFY